MSVAKKIERAFRQVFAAEHVAVSKQQSFFAVVHLQNAVHESELRNHLIHFGVAIPFQYGQIFGFVQNFGDFKGRVAFGKRISRPVIIDVAEQNALTALYDIS